MRRSHRLAALRAACAMLCFLSGGCGRSSLGLETCGPKDQPVDLTGKWLDGDKAELVLFDFEQGGKTLVSTRVVPRTCRHRDGQGTTSEGRADFVGSFDSCGFKGQITVCRFGRNHDPSLNGLVQLDFTATLTSSHDRLKSRQIHDPVANATLEVVYERLGCEPRPPEDFLLPGSEVIEFVPQYNLARGEITYVGESQTTLDSVRRVAAGVTGSVKATPVRNPDGSTIVSVSLDNGNRLVYRLFGTASQASVSFEEEVNPTTEIGSVGRIGTGAHATFKLKLAGTTGEEPINPDCIEE